MIPHRHPVVLAHDLLHLPAYSSDGSKRDQQIVPDVFWPGSWKTPCGDRGLLFAYAGHLPDLPWCPSCRLGWAKYRWGKPDVGGLDGLEFRPELLLAEVGVLPRAFNAAPKATDLCEHCSTPFARVCNRQRFCTQKCQYAAKSARRRHPEEAQRRRNMAANWMRAKRAKDKEAA